MEFVEKSRAAYMKRSGKNLEAALYDDEREVLVVSLGITMIGVLS